ncbi:MAG: hypothetical protein KDD61_16160 [Bdellovibrionales bacterium]|nr:hypothetical protein [Bdellovibrionales bacterium]
MKSILNLMSLIALVSSLFAFSAQARTARGGHDGVRPGETCSFIASKNAYYGSECANVIAKAEYISSEASAGCYAVAEGNAYYGYTCMQNILNKDYQPDAVDVCITIAGSNAYYGSECLKVIGDKEYRHGVADSCKATAKSNAYYGYTCMQKSGVKMENPGAGGRRCMPMDQIANRLNNSINAMERGNYYRSENIQRGLLRQLRNCR